MKFSPLSIKQQEFSKSMRGYETEEVQAFLEKLADEFDNLYKENEKLKRELDELNIKVADYKRIEKNLQDTLLKAQDSTSRTMESSKKQANLLVKEAELKASQLLEKAREQANEIRDAVIRLRDEKDFLIARLKSIVNTQSNLLETKVAYAGEENPAPRKTDESKDLDLNIDDIVNKIL